MKKINQPESLLQNAIMDTKANTNCEQLVEIILPTNISDIISALNKDIANAETLINHQMKMTYALIDSAKSNMKSLDSTSQESITLKAVDATQDKNIDPISNSSLSNTTTSSQSNMMQKNTITIAPEIQQRIDEITASINSRFMKMVENISQKSYSINQLVMEKSNINSAIPKKTTED